MEKLKTATGKEFDCDYFNPFPLVGQINIRILGESLATIATVLQIPLKQCKCGGKGSTPPNIRR